MHAKKVVRAFGELLDGLSDLRGTTRFLKGLVKYAFTAPPLLHRAVLCSSTCDRRCHVCEQMRRKTGGGKHFGGYAQDLALHQAGVERLNARAGRTTSTACAKSTTRSCSSFSRPRWSRRWRKSGQRSSRRRGPTSSPSSSLSSRTPTSRVRALIFDLCAIMRRFGG